MRDMAQRLRGGVGPKYETGREVKGAFKKITEERPDWETNPPSTKKAVKFLTKFTTQGAP